MVGNASFTETAMRLTTPEVNQAGAAWLKDKQYLAAGFETAFQFQLTEQGGFGPFKGSDGFAFVIQNAGPDALGGRGSAGGFAVEDTKRKFAIPRSLAAFFDTHRNRFEGDPSGNYVSFRNYGKGEEARWPAPRLAFTKRLKTNLKDGAVHAVRVLYRPPALAVFLDDGAAPVLQSVVDLAPVLDGEGRAWIGFTASTGSGSQNHDILNWSFTGTAASSTASVVSSNITFNMSACLPDRKLCTPEKPFVEHRTPGSYHVILPANLIGGVRVPAQAGKKPVVTDERGIVCWSSKNNGSSECSGPSGALTVLTNDGQIWLSVASRDNSNFKDNEGFFEFDLEFQ